MNITLLLQKIHGHVALMTVALLLHPVLTLRNQRPFRPQTRLSCYLGVAGAVLTNAIGWTIYPDYRAVLKGPIYAISGALGALFELKEHLAWYSLLLALAAGVMTTQVKAPLSALNRPLRVTLLLSACLMIVAGAIGIWVAATRGFPYTS